MNRVYKYGEGDDNENLEDDFNTWKEGIWEELKKFAQVSAPNGEEAANGTKSASKSASGGLPFTLRVDNSLKEIDLENYDHKNDPKDYDFQAKQYLASSLVNFTCIRELRQRTDDGSTLHVEIDCASAGLSYKTAQNLAVYPENSGSLVHKAADLLNLNLDDVFDLEQNLDGNAKGKFKYPIPSPLSVRTYLTKFCDLQSALRYLFIKFSRLICIEKSN